MEKQDNTGLGLIKTTIERVQNDKSLFNSALKKLVNSSEEELGDFLKRKVENLVKINISHLISGERNLIIKALDGKRLIYNSEKTFKSRIDIGFINCNLNETGVATIETPVQVYEMVCYGTLMNAFGPMPGGWNQKWVSQSQVIDFCEMFPDWLGRGKGGTIFLIKKDENEPIDEDNPQNNSIVVCVRVNSDGLSSTIYRLKAEPVWCTEYFCHLVVPKFIPRIV